MIRGLRGARLGQLLRWWWQGCPTRTVIIDRSRTNAAGSTLHEGICAEVAILG